jgi:sec-independent protein translocase protein TatB
VAIRDSLQPYDAFARISDRISEDKRLRRLGIAASAYTHYDEPMSFSETIFLFLLALVVFGPKKLPEIARQAGKLLAELRRASNEFKSQIETEIARAEIEKPQNTRAPSTAPQGTVASLGLNPSANETQAHDADATLAAPLADATLPSPQNGNSANGNTNGENPLRESSNLISNPAAPANDLETVADARDPHA